MNVKRTIKALALSFLLIGSWGCSESSELVEVEMPVPATDVRNFPNRPVRVDTTITLQGLFKPRNGCGRYSGVDTSTVGNVFTLKYYALYPIEGTDVVCADFAKPLVFNKRVRFTTAGTYVFKFWVSESEYLIKEVVVQ